MGRINDFLNKHRQVVRRQVDITNMRLMATRDWLNPYMPFASYDDYSLLVLRAKKNRAIAHLVGFEGEIPGSSAGTFETGEVSVAKIAKSYVYTEEDMILMRRWEQNVSGVPDSVKDFFFGTITDLPGLIQDTHTLLAVMAMIHGAIDFVDLVTGIPAQVTYTTNTAQYPADLAGSAQWNDPVGGRPIEGLVNHSRSYREIGRPTATLMNEETMDKMVDTAEFRTAVAARKNVDASTAGSFKVGRDDVDEIFRVNGLPPLQIVESAYEEELPNNTRNQKFFIPEGYYTFAWDGMGERAVGPVESNEGRAGIYTFTEEVSKEPPVDRSVGVSTGCPMFFDTRKMGGRKVYTPA